MIDISKIFLNDTYRKLINHGRTYASFTTDELELIFKDINKNDKYILDPMSGYGGLMSYSNNLNFSTFNLELNLPAFYWQKLINPSTIQIYEHVIDELLSQKSKIFPKIKIKALASDDWFTKEGLELSQKLLSNIQDSLSKIGITDNDISISLILPFIKRFSTCITGDITHLKKGGITVFEGWEKDFEFYLKALLENRFKKIKQTKSNHSLYLGDARDFKFPQNFSTVITSPPYPNYRDYYKMFAPENHFLEKINIQTSQTSIIGSNVVKGKIKGTLTSKIALNFLNELENFKGNRKTTNDIKAYYLPYFYNYFSDLELTCKNIVLHLNKEAECYFSVVNNATRNLIIPVAQVIEEIFKNEGFKTEYIYNKEVFHVGTKNPNARGLKAKHNKYLIKACR